MYTNGGVFMLNVLKKMVIYVPQTLDKEEKWNLYDSVFTGLAFLSERLPTLNLLKGIRMYSDPKARIYKLEIPMNLKKYEGIIVEAFTQTHLRNYGVNVLYWMIEFTKFKTCLGSISVSSVIYEDE